MEILGRRDHAAGRPGAGGVQLGDVVNLGVGVREHELGVVAGVGAAQLGVGAGHVRPLQPERVGDAPPDLLDVRPAGDSLDDHPGEHEVGVGVAPALARREGGLMAHGDPYELLGAVAVEAALQDARPGVLPLHLLVHGVVEDAAGLVEQPPDSDLVAVADRAGQPGLHGVVEAQPALGVEQQHHGRGERLGEAADPEPVLPSARPTALQVGHARRAEPGLGPVAHVGEDPRHSAVVHDPVEHPLKLAVHSWHSHVRDSTCLANAKSYVAFQFLVNAFQRLQTTFQQLTGGINCNEPDLERNGEVAMRCVRTQY